jgi:hypothetical protein
VERLDHVLLTDFLLTWETRMSDYIAAYIRIGGTVSKQLVPELCRAITQQRLALEWGETHFAPTSAGELLEVRTSVSGADVLQLCDDDACWGEFAELEKFLIDHGIGFDRLHEAKFDINARLTQFRPDSGQHDFQTTVEGHVVVPLQDVQHLRDDLVQVRDILQSNQFDLAREKLQATLDNLAGRVKELAPPLSSLEFSE